MHACMYVCMHVCMYVCMYVGVYIYIYIYVLFSGGVFFFHRRRHLSRHTERIPPWPGRVKNAWSKHGSNINPSTTEWIMLEPCLLQPCFHVAGWQESQRRADPHASPCMKRPLPTLNLPANIIPAKICISVSLSLYIYIYTHTYVYVHKYNVYLYNLHMYIYIYIYIVDSKSPGKSLRLGNSTPQI